MLDNLNRQLVSYLLRKNGTHSTLNAHYFSLIADNLVLKYKWK
jgi:hypothetical protein